MKMALGYGLPVVSGIGVSSCVATVKNFPFLTQDVFVAGFWSIGIGSLISAVFMAIFENPTLPANWIDWLILQTHCWSYVITWLATVYAPKYISGNTINIIFSTSAILMLIPQYTVLSSIHPGHRNWMEVVGVLLVLLGSSLGSIFEIFSRK